ncbi:MAG: AAA family ATPase, partial [Nocardioides sp.]
MALVGRGALLSVLADDHAAARSVLLIGPRGTGRTSVLEAVAAQDPGRRAAVVSGRERHAGVPLGPWGGLLGEHDARLDEPLSLYTRLPVQMAAELDLLLIDDVDLFDPASALLTVQLARAGLCIVATAHDAAAIPDALRDTVRRWRRRDLDLLTDRDLEEVAEQTLDGPLTAPSAARMARWSSGRPAITVALAEAARAAGRVRPTPGGLRVDEPVVADDVLAYLGIDAARARRERAALELIAVSGGLPRTWLDADEQLRLTRLGLVRCQDDDVVLAAPLLTAWVLRGITPDHRDQLYARAASLMRTHAPDDRRGHVLTARAGRTRALAETVEVAAWLASLSRLAEASALLAGGPPGPADSTADQWAWCLARARIHRDLDDPGAAVDAVDQAIEHATDDAQLVQAVSMWASVLGGLLDEDDRLEERINRILPLLSDDGARASVRAMLSRRRAILGERGPGPRGTRDGDDVPDPIVTLLREAMGGSLEFAREHFIPPSDDRVDEDEDVDELLQVLGRFLGLVYDGDLVAGRAEADRRHRDALDAALPSLGLWSYNRTKIAFHAGQYGLAVVRGREMRRHLAWRDVAGQRLPGE